jgi:hypothetical protein
MRNHNLCNLHQNFSNQEKLNRQDMLHTRENEKFLNTLIRLTDGKKLLAQAHVEE